VEVLQSNTRPYRPTLAPDPHLFRSAKICQHFDGPIICRLLSSHTLGFVAPDYAWGGRAYKIIIERVMGSSGSSDQPGPIPFLSYDHGNEVTVFD
jgi:hypothetical protein